MFNLYQQVPEALPEESIESIQSRRHVRIERIVSRGQASAEGFWYDQPQHEFVVLLAGAARLRLEEQVLELRPGDCLEIPAHRRHRVEWTSPSEPTIWLTVHYDD